MTQRALSGILVPDVVVQVLVARRQGILDGTLRPRLDLGTYFFQTKLPGAV